MTRFDADDSAERRDLFADAIAAHRTRGSPYLTIEVSPAATGGDDGDAGEDDGDADRDDGDAGEDGGGDAGDEPPPWIQFSERTFNLDCTDEELSRLKSLLSEFPEFRIEQLEAPEDADGTNVRITARSDAERLADFAERAFREVYGLHDRYRAWVTEI